MASTSGINPNIDPPRSNSGDHQNASNEETPRVPNPQPANANNDNNNNNNNNNIPLRNNLVAVRERLFQALFFRISLIYARTISPPIRRFLEFFVLLKALMLLSLLVYIHFAFVKVPVSCLDQYKNSWPRDGILRVEIIKNADAAYSLNDSYQKEQRLQQHQMALMNVFGHDFHLIFDGAAPTIDFEEANQPEEGVTPHLEAEDPNAIWGDLSDYPSPKEVIKDEEKNASHESIFDFIFQPFLDSGETLNQTNEETAESTEMKVDSKSYDSDSLSGWEDDYYILEYALEHGFLRLSSYTRTRLNIPVKLVILDPNNNTCFGDALSRFILDEFLGYDDILLSSLKSLAEKEREKHGFVRNVVTGEHYRFVNVLPHSGNLIYSFFVMIIFTLSVSMLLRYSHYHIFLFIIHLLQMIEMNVSISFPASPLLTVILALVGMEAIMSEFFKDTSTAFYVIVLIWLSDQYEAICCHTRITKKYWLRFFYLYHFAFYAYHYKFNGQYAGIALMTSWLFIFHSMLYFFHHYELPAILQQAQVVGRIQTFNIVLRNAQNNNNNANGPGAAPPPANGTGGAQAAGVNRGPEDGQNNNPTNANPRAGGPRVINFVLRNNVRRQTSFTFLVENLRNIVQNAQDARRNGALRFRVANSNSTNSTVNPQSTSSGNSDSSQSDPDPSPSTSGSQPREPESITKEAPEVIKEPEAVPEELLGACALDTTQQDSKSASQKDELLQYTSFNNSAEDISKNIEEHSNLGSSACENAYEFDFPDNSVRLRNIQRNDFEN